MRRSLVFRFLLSAAAAGLIAGCSGDGAGAFKVPGASPTDKALAPEVAQVRDYMLDWYLWYREMPNNDLTQLVSAEQALAALRVPQDRFSFVTSKSAMSASIDENKSTAFGISYVVQPDNSVVIGYVPEGSPAHAADVRRGDQIVAIDGTAVSTLIATDALSSAFGPSEVGVQRTFHLRRAAAEFDKTLVKAQYQFKAASNVAIIDVGGHKYGYLYFSSFTRLATNEVGAALQQLSTGGAQSLIIDVRGNGGGYLQVATDIASHLTSAGDVGQVFQRIVYNDKHIDLNRMLTLSAATKYSFDSIAMLTSRYSCSATEALLFGLRSYRPVVSIGETTCGKPYGFFGQDVGVDKQLFAISLTDGSRDKVADYQNGIAPTCHATDDYATPLGTAGEPLAAAAITRLATGACAQSANSTGAVKSLREQPMSWRYESEQDFAHIR